MYFSQNVVLDIIVLKVFIMRGKNPETPIYKPSAHAAVAAWNVDTTIALSNSFAWSLVCSQVQNDPRRHLNHKKGNSQRCRNLWLFGK